MWLLISRAVEPQQQSELRNAIEAWLRELPLGETAMPARAVGFTSSMAAATKSTPSQATSVFNQLMLDPLPGLDPATREIAPH